MYHKVLFVTVNDLKSFKIICIETERIYSCVMMRFIMIYNKTNGLRKFTKYVPCPTKSNPDCGIAYCTLTALSEKDLMHVL